MVVNRFRLKPKYLNLKLIIRIDYLSNLGNILVYKTPFCSPKVNRYIKKSLVYDKRFLV